ncbi:MAG: type 4 fimbriae expression regulatory protein PilR [Gammaproteobacteria bacterium]|nr:MAG: type 4 fimbriae expression regulatory protein PilR [Gammaproteobacteria bacterium]
MTLPRILIVDDEPDLCELLEITLSRMKLNTASAQNLAAAKRLMEEKHFDLVLTDMRLPDGDGLDFVEWVQRRHPGTPIAVITAHGNMEAAIRALKSGAFDFISKPLDLKQLRQLVASALKLGPAAGAENRPDQPLLLGESPAMQQLKKTIAKLARSQAPVHIHGESGTGKELVARLIHAQSARRDGPFVAVNCSAIPSELMESEFFGHLKGSFTGAVSDKQGLFAAASGGTLFLDEIAELPVPMQVKLLRAIQERAVRPVGGTHELPVDVRILSASHKDLDRLVAEGQFRQDLYYRINVIRIDVPPLRERREDIPLLATRILETIGAKQGQSYTLSDAALAALQQHRFPGNVRELENILERAAALCEGNLIRPEDLGLNGGLAAAPPPGRTEEGDLPLDDRLEEEERRTILEALEATRWNKTRAAERLGISFRQLRYRIKKLGIE